jgi:hypothetical protein
MSFKVKSRTIGEANMPWSAITYPVIASIKHDGRNTIVHKKGNTITYETSGGKEFKLINNEPFDQLPDGHFFTEMLGYEIEGKLGDRIHSGIQTTCMSNTAKGLPNHCRPNWKIFSFLEDEDYIKGKSKYKYKEILNRISHWNGALESNLCPRFMRCEDEYQLKLYYEQVIKEGWEGLMVAQPDLIWANSTSRLKTLCKLKGRYTMKGICINTIDGEGKYTNMIGSLVIQLSDSVSVSIGSGLTDHERATGSFVGKVIEFEYEQLSKDGIPLQPTFVSIREAL